MSKAVTKYIVPKSESGVQLFARLVNKSSVEDLDRKLFEGGLSSGNIIEFYGREGSGRSQYLLCLIANAILPTTWNGHNVGGLCVEAAFVDLGYQFSLLRLIKILEARLVPVVSEVHKLGEDCCPDGVSPLSSKSVTEVVEDLVKDSLRRLNIFVCESFDQLLFTLHSLDLFLTQHPLTRILVIDSISFFYYGVKYLQDDSFFDSIADILEKLKSTYDVVIFVTKASLFEKRTRRLERQDEARSEENASNDVLPEHYEYLGRKWQRMISSRFLFARTGDRINAPFIVCMDGVDRVRESSIKYFRIEDHGVSFCDINVSI